MWILGGKPPFFKATKTTVKRWDKWKYCTEPVVVLLNAWSVWKNVGMATIQPLFYGFGNGGVPWKSACVLYCPIKISSLLNCLCVLLWILVLESQQSPLFQILVAVCVCVCDVARKHVRSHGNTCEVARKHMWGRTETHVRSHGNTCEVARKHMWGRTETHVR